MPKLSVHAFTISLDGYGAGPDQTIETPLGVGGEELHGWMVKTRTFHKMAGKPGGEAGIEDDLTMRGFENVGAWIMGRNMFGPVRGEWPDDSWKGWWGDNPPYHVPTFVLTNHARKPVEMAGGTTFHFVTGGIEEALELARDAAGDKDIRVGGGVSTVRQYLAAGLIDDLHVAVSPIFLGRGESLFAGLDLPALGYVLTERISTEHATHLMIAKQA